MLAAFHYRPTRTTRNVRHIKVGGYQYLPKDLLGEGFSSKVYKGVDAVKGSTLGGVGEVAIKVINPSILKEQINLILLESELKMLELMKGCQHILELHSIIQQGSYTYIVTEVCKTDVSKILMPLLPLQTTQKYIWQLLQGYKQIFMKQVIHRDLKPANLLLDNEGNLKIADFGFAIRASDARTQSGFNIGSPLYMAPEALKSNDYSYKSDIWAIGIIVYQLLTGDTPWKADTQQQLYQKLRDVRIQRVLKDTSFPDFVTQLLLRTLQFDKKARITPEQLILFQTKVKTAKSQAQLAQAADQSKQLTPKKMLYIPKVGKNTKTQKFYKPSPNNHSGYCKKNTQNRDQPVAVNIRNAYRPEQTERLQKRLQNQETIFLPVGKEGSNSTAKTKGSNTMTATEGGQLSKQEAKHITDKLVYYVHICRLYFKLLGRLDACIGNNFNQNAISNISNIRDDFYSQCCSIMVSYLYKVKNLAANNFLGLQSAHLQFYVASSQYKKLKKICVDYVDKYSRQEDLKHVWHQAAEPDFDHLAGLTVQIIQQIWKEICQKNQEEIILLEFLVFSAGVVEGLKTNRLEEIEGGHRIQDFVDTMPNPPTYDRFRAVVKGAKKIIQQHKNKQTELKCQN